MYKLITYQDSDCTHFQINLYDRKSKNKSKFYFVTSLDCFELECCVENSFKAIASVPRIQIKKLLIRSNTFNKPVCWVEGCILRQ